MGGGTSRKYALKDPTIVQPLTGVMNLTYYWRHISGAVDSYTLGGNASTNDGASYVIAATMVTPNMPTQYKHCVVAGLTLDVVSKDGEISTIDTYSIIRALNGGTLPDGSGVGQKDFNNIPFTLTT